MTRAITRLLPLLVTAVLAMACTVSAQRSYVVSASGGQGVDFRSLRAAVAAAQPGDRIFVRSGQYLGPITNKGLTILGSPGATLRYQKGGDGALIHDLPAGQNFVLSGFVIVDSTLRFLEPVLSVRACKGRVLLQDIRAETPSLFHSVRVETSDAVAIDGCLFKPMMTVVSSDLTLTRSQLLGSGSSKPLSSSTGAALFATDSRIVIADSSLRSFDSQLAAGPACEIRGSGSLNILCGTQLIAGRGGIGSSPALETKRSLNPFRGTLTVDPRASFSTPLPPSAQLRKQTALRVSGSPLGGKSGIVVCGRDKDVFSVFVSLPERPLSIPGIGLWHLKLSTLVAIGSGVFSASETASLSLQHSSTPAIRGLALAYQAVSLNGQRLELSNAVLQALR